MKKRVYTQKELDELKAKAYASNQAYNKLLHDKRLGISEWTDVGAKHLFAPLLNKKDEEEKGKKLEGSLVEISDLVKQNLFTNFGEAKKKLEEFEKTYGEKVKNLRPYQEIKRVITLKTEFISGIYDQVLRNKDQDPLYGLTFDNSVREFSSPLTKEDIVMKGESHLKLCFGITGVILSYLNADKEGSAVRRSNYYITINASQADKPCFEVRKLVDGGDVAMTLQVDFSEDLLRVLTENIVIESQRENYLNLFFQCCNDYYVALSDKDAHEGTDFLMEFDKKDSKFLKYERWIKPYVHDRRDKLRKEKTHPMDLRTEGERRQPDFYSPTKEEEREKRMKEEQRKAVYQTPTRSSEKKAEELTLSPEGEKVVTEKAAASTALGAPLKKEEIEQQLKQEAKRGSKGAQHLVERLTPLGQKPFEEYYNKLKEPRPEREEALDQWKKTLDSKHRAIYFKVGTTGHGNLITIDPNDDQKLKRLFVLIGTKKSGNTADTLQEFTAILDSLYHDKKIDVKKYKAYLRKLYHG